LFGAYLLVNTSSYNAVPTMYRTCVAGFYVCRGRRYENNDYKVYKEGQILHDPHHGGWGFLSVADNDMTLSQPLSAGLRPPTK